MSLPSRLAMAALGVLAIAAFVATSADARPGQGRGHQPRPSASVVNTTPQVQTPSVTVETPDVTVSTPEVIVTQPTSPSDLPTDTPVTDGPIPEEQPQHLPPGLQRQVDSGRGLPPGLQRQVDNGRGLPPGLQRAR